MNLLFRTPSDSQLASIAQSSLNNEIHCSSLPYGALRCTPHIVTYHTILCLSFGRKPLWPFFRIHFSQVDLLLGTIGLGLTTAVHVAILMRRRVGVGVGRLLEVRWGDRYCL
ncbi:hypothetical protein K443DRAFT_662616 [Laccaria amethystina LaAM-08-1]|uniref:Uncharacterized protein n=1 Tax=Laccaria amethystina LaAM-08-1 TaxID=1095629 RepID=A0A0C9WXK9_9AGAR|nr:hypothetical protein K443DRAFT_662616 [Laccaria amethystina LaAM-08-1]